MIAWGVEALVASALLIALVLAIRTPVRRAFGAQVAYALWALPVLRLALPPMPANWRAAAAAPVSAVSEQVLVYVVPSASVAAAPLAPAAAAASDAPSLVTIVAVAWGIGALLFLAWHVASYARFRGRLLRSARPIERIAGIRVIEAATDGPVAFGVARRYVAFPRDFAGRYDADERALALAHELGHHQRGDLVANWVALAMLALHWFNPVAWLAFRAFRADQEMANDARVLARCTAAERHAYACAIVKAAHGGVIAAACHLHTIQDIKGRLRMLAAKPTRARIAAGAATIAAFGTAALGLTASGTQAAERVRTRVAAATGVDLAPLAPAVAPVAATTATTVTTDETRTGEERPKRARRVIVVKDGKTTTYEGEAADAFVAANPVPVPPAPPAVPVVPSTLGVPPMPPAPPVFAMRDGTRLYNFRSGKDGAWPDMPRVISSSSCNGADRQPVVEHREEKGRRLIVICQNRIARLSENAERQALRSQAYAVDAQAIARQAQLGALAGLRSARARMAANPSLSGEARAEALASMDESIADLAANAKAD